MSKRNQQRKHAVRRARERHSFELHADLQQKIIASIQGHGPFGAKFVERQSNRVSLWSVWLPLPELKEIRIVYDRVRKVIVTVLPD